MFLKLKQGRNARSEASIPASAFHNLKPYPLIHVFYMYILFKRIKVKNSLKIKKEEII